jgi:hypothetical protein
MKGATGKINQAITLTGIRCLNPRRPENSKKVEKSTIPAKINKKTYENSNHTMKKIYKNSEKVKVKSYTVVNLMDYHDSSSYEDDHCKSNNLPSEPAHRDNGDRVHRDNDMMSQGHPRTWRLVSTTTSAPLQRESTNNWRAQ